MSIYPVLHYMRYHSIFFSNMSRSLIGFKPAVQSFFLNKILFKKIHTREYQLSHV